MARLSSICSNYLANGVNFGTNAYLAKKKRVFLIFCNTFYMKLFSSLQDAILLAFFTYKDVKTDGYQITARIVRRQFMSLNVHFNNMQHVLLKHFLSRFPTKTLYIFLIPPIDAEHATHPFTFISKY